jgi:hypothetical protein
MIDAAKSNNTFVDPDKMVANIREDTRLHDKLRELYSKAPKANENQVPRAPFVTNTKAWSFLVAKRMLKYAADKGYDGVTWTTGRQQVDRYAAGLRKEADEIAWEKTPEGVHLKGYKFLEDSYSITRSINRYHVERAGQNKSVASFDTLQEAKEFLEATKRETKKTEVFSTSYSENQLPAVFQSQEVADLILSKDKGTFKNPAGKKVTIDDPGMSGYYDGIFKQVLEEQAGKRGGGKASKEKIAVSNDWRYTKRGQHGGPHYGETEPIDVDEVHFLPVNPRMKEPWPLFAGAPPGLTGGKKEEEKKSKLRDFLKKGGA